MGRLVSFGKFFFPVVCFVISISSYAKNWHTVGPGSSYDFNQIQDAIDSPLVKKGDVVLVEPFTRNEQSRSGLGSGEMSSFFQRSAIQLKESRYARYNSIELSKEISILSSRVDPASNRGYPFIIDSTDQPGIRVAGLAQFETVTIYDFVVDLKGSQFAIELVSSQGTIRLHHGQVWAHEAYGDRAPSLIEIKSAKRVWLNEILMDTKGNGWSSQAIKPESGTMPAYDGVSALRVGDTNTVYLSNSYLRALDSSPNTSTIYGGHAIEIRAGVVFANNAGVVGGDSQTGIGGFGVVYDHPMSQAHECGGSSFQPGEGQRNGKKFFKAYTQYASSSGLPNCTEFENAPLTAKIAGGMPSLYGVDRIRPGESLELSAHSVEPRYVTFVSGKPEIWYRPFNAFGPVLHTQFGATMTNLGRVLTQSKGITWVSELTSAPFTSSLIGVPISIQAIMEQSLLDPSGIVLSSPVMMTVVP